LFWSKNYSFLKSVFLYTITAFGGPQGHLGMLKKTFVQKKFITEESLIDLFAFSQILPGASSTQMITLIGYKRGGFFLSLVTLLIWILPACILMGVLSFLISSNAHESFNTSLFKFIKPMTIGFLLYSLIGNLKISVNNKITLIIFFASTLFTTIFFKQPWIFPLLIVLAGIATNFSNRRIPSNTETKPKSIQWKNLWLFVFIFVLAGLLSESARKNEWHNRNAFNLFENFYRFGSLVYGGGDVLFPMMLDQYVARPTDKKTQIKNPNTIKISNADLVVGFGIIRAIPGPVFSVGSYVGGMAMKSRGKITQFYGCIIGSVALFLPGILLMYFFFPIWENLKRYVIIFRAIEGIKSVVPGFMCAAAIYLISDLFFVSSKMEFSISLIILLSTFIILLKTKIPPPLIVIACLVMGFIL
jgi:chromate transporter